jgi:hypothetical protein
MRQDAAMRTPSTVLAAFGPLLVLAGCTLPGVPAEATRHEIFFGLSRQGAADVTGEEFDAFVAKEIVPLYPGGFTIVPATGYWRGEGGATAKESTRVLILHAEEKDDAKLNKLCQKYAKQFGQEAVLRTRTGSRSILLTPGRK